MLCLAAAVLPLWQTTTTATCQLDSHQRCTVSTLLQLHSRYSSATEAAATPATTITSISTIFITVVGSCPFLHHTFATRRHALSLCRRRIHLERWFSNPTSFRFLTLDTRWFQHCCVAFVVSAAATVKDCARALRASLHLDCDKSPPGCLFPALATSRSSFGLGRPLLLLSPYRDIPTPKYRPFRSATILYIHSAKDHR